MLGVEVPPAVAEKEPVIDVSANMTEQSIKKLPSSDVFGAAGTEMTWWSTSRGNDPKDGRSTIGPAWAKLRSTDRNEALSQT